MAANALTITDENFDELVLKSDKPVLIDFWAAWCGPCVAIAPIVEELASEYKDKVVIGKLDVDANAKVTMNYRVMNIPTMLFFKGGQVVDKQVGGVPKNVLKGKLETLLAKA